MHCQTHVGERILHFRTIVEAETAHESITHAAAAENLKRVVRLPVSDWTAEPGLDRMIATLETKTVWHPLGV